MRRTVTYLLTLTAAEAVTIDAATSDRFSPLL